MMPAKVKFISRRRIVIAVDFNSSKILNLGFGMSQIFKSETKLNPTNMKRHILIKASSSSYKMSLFCILFGNIILLLSNVNIHTVGEKKGLNKTRF